MYSLNCIIMIIFNCTHIYTNLHTNIHNRYNNIHILTSKIGCKKKKKIVDI